MALCVTAHDGCFGWFIGTSLRKSTLRAFLVPLGTGKCSEVRLFLEKSRGGPGPDFLYAAPDATAYAAFFKESRMKCAGATNPHRKSGFYCSRYPSSQPIQLVKIVSNGQHEDSHRGGRPGCTPQHACTSPRRPLRHDLHRGCNRLYG